METKIFKSINQVIRCGSGANLNLFRYTAKSCDSQGVVTATSYGASDEYPMSIRSASDGSSWNTRVWKYAAMLLCVLMLGIGNAWAGGGSSNYYASLKITQSGPTGAGSVYVANSNSKPGTANPNTVVQSAATTTSGGDVTMYWWVEINPGYNVTLSDKVTGGPYSAATASGNVSCKASTSKNGVQAYTATATFVAVTVNSVSPTSVALDPTDASADYPFTVSFATSNLKTVALDLTKSPETADGKFTITSWALDGANVVATGKFNGGGTYGGASRNHSTTVSLQSKATGSGVKSCTVTANFPALAFVDADVTDVYTTQSDATKTGSTVFNFNYGAEDDFPTTPTFTHTSGSGAFAVTGYEVEPDFSKGTCKVTVDYSFNPNGAVGTTKEELKITSVGGTVYSATVTGEAEAEATDDASVTTVAGVTTNYATFAAALAAANASSGCTLTLLRNVDLGTITATNNITKAMTIDLNGKTLKAAVNATSVGILTITQAVAVTIKDSKTGGKIINEVDRNSEVRTIFVNKAGATLTLESGTLAVNNLRQYASAANASLGVTAASTSCSSRVIHQVAGSTVNINGGRLEAYGTRSVYGIVQGSSAATNKAGTTVLNITDGEIYSEGPYNIFGVYAYGKVNLSGGIINVHVNTNMIDARYAADNANNTYNGYAYGIYLKESVSATATSCYAGILNMAGGTINVTNDRTLSVDRRSYGVLFNAASAVVDAGKTGADGTLTQKASATGSITGGEINVTSGTQYSYGVYVLGNYNSYDNTYHAVQVKNCKITAKAYVYAYGVYANAGFNGTNNGCYAGDVELTNCDVYAESLNTSTAAAVWVNATGGTLFKDDSNATKARCYGEYAVAGKAVINNGKYEAKTKTTSAYAVGTASRYKTTYDAETTVAANRKLGGNAEAYPTLIIHGGTFKATTSGTNTTARAVSNGGYCTIDGGEFEAYAGGTTADGIYTVSGKLKASGAKITVSATGTAYGVRVDAANVPYNTNAAWTGFNYAGDAELNNLDVTVTTRTADKAHGVYVNAAAYQYTQSAFDTYMQGQVDAGKTTQANYDIWAAVFPGNSSYAIAGKAVINGGKYTVSAATTTAYGVWTKEEQVAADTKAHAAPEVSINNAKFIVTTNGTTTAYGVYSGGDITIDGCDFTVQPKTTTAYGVYQYSNKATITNTKFDVKGTGTVYGLYANAAISGTHGWDYHGEFELGEGNDMTVAATGGNTSHVLTLIASKKNINVEGGSFNGNYANAASAHITGGKYKATATGTTSYVLNLSDQQVQGDVISRPACIIEDGKFWALASGGTTGICSANGQIGHIVLKGGFYNVNTNLAKYKEEGKNVNDVLAGTPEYTEGYRYKVTSELSGATVCKVYTNANSPSLRAEYATLEEALQYVNANTGTNLTIVMIADYTLKKGDYLLPSNATLVIPNDITRKSAIGTTPSRQNVNTPAPVQLVMLTFEAGVNMTVKGTIETSAVNTAANGGSAITGAPTGNFGRLHIVEGSTMTLESGANLNCWGYTTGKGEINALNGSTVREGFQLGYWRGGTATSAMLNNKGTWHAFPVTDYFIQNVEAPITFRPGAQLLGYSGVNVSIVGIQAANNVKLVGTSASMFLMEEADASEDTYVRKEYDPETDRAIWTVNSGAKIGSFSFSLAGNTVNSADYYLPISNNMTIYVNEGEFTITQDALLIPGAQVIISKLGKLTVASGKRLFVMDNEDWPGFLKSGTTTVSRWYYNALYSPSWTTNPRTLKYPPTTTRLPDGEIFVHGETEGSYYTSTSGANIHSTNDDAGKVKFVANAGADNSIQHVVNTDNERVTINFTTAQLKNETPETPYTSSKNTVAGEAFVYMEQQWVKVIDGCLTTRTDGSGTHEYAKPSDVVEVVSNGDNAYRDKATNSRYFINAEKALSNAQCVWWEVEPVTSGTYAGDYMANQEKYENYGAYYYWDGSVGYWKPRYVTVTWKNQDGTTLATYTNVMCNTSPKYLSASPTWANTSIEKHDWVGWRDADGNIYDKNAVLPVAQGNMTYTAYYNVSKYEYTIKFVNPDKTVIWAGLVEAGTIPECPAEPTQAPTVSTVYTFTGWNTTPVEVTGTATYTAVYASSTRKYHVTFYNYDAQSVLYEADVDYNTRPVYGGVTPFRANTSSFSYEWTGWQQGANNYGKTDNLAIVTGNVNYIATFSQTDLKYQVFFKRQDGSIIDAPFFNYEETPESFPANPTLPSTVSTDYTFSAWSPAELAPVTEDGMVYTALFNESPRQYTAHFVNYDGKTLNADKTIDYNTIPAYTGATPFKPNDTRNSYEFSGWAWEASSGLEAGSVAVGEALPAIKGDVIFTAQFTPVLLQFNVVFQYEDGTQIDLLKKKYGNKITISDAPAATKEATAQYTYTFDRWDPVLNSTEVEVTKDLTYTAKFTQSPRSYNVTLNTNGGTVNAGNVTSYTYGQDAALPTNVTRTGYDFAGWYDNSGLTGSAVTNIASSATGNKTYWAKWNIHTHKFAWDFVGGSTTSSSHTAANNALAYGSAISYPANNTMSKEGYDFAGWSSNATTMPDNDLTITAQWTPKQYTITFDSKGGSAVASITAAYGAVITAPANPTKTGYTFDSWKPAVPNTMPLNGLTCEAQWTINQYQLTVATNNSDWGTVTGGGKYDYNTNHEISATPKEGYKFVQWNDGNKIATRNVTIPAEDVTYTATFEANVANYTVKHLQQNTNDDYYTEVASEVLSGKVGENTAASEKTYTGFDAQEFLQKTIAADGSTVVDIHYDRKIYQITWEVWLSGDMESSRIDDLRYGVMPSYGPDPTKAMSEKEIYTFSGWNQDLEVVTENKKYTGSFKVSPRPYTITFLNDNGDTLQSSQVGWGQTPKYEGSRPVSSHNEDGYSYDFAGWNPAIAAVKGEATYTARYNRSTTSITVNPLDTVTINTNTSTTTTVIKNEGTLTVGGDTLQSNTIIVEAGGQLDVTEGGSIDADVFIIQATTEDQGEDAEEVQVSGELSNSGTQNLKNVYYDLTRKHGTENFLARVWYAVAVPWAVEVPTYSNGGVYIKRGEEFVPQRLGATFDLLSYDGNCRAKNGSGANCWVYLEDEIDGGTAQAVMVPGKLYMIYLTEETSTIRFKKKAGLDSPIHTNSLTVIEYSSADDNDANWNGIANPATYRAYMDVTANGLVQKFVPGTQPRDPGRYMTLNLDDKQAVGQPFFVQIDPDAGTTVVAHHHTPNQSAPAPRRAMNDREQETRYAIGIAANGKLADRLYVQTAEEKENQYVIGKDMSKMGVSSYVAQMWVNRYETKLCLNTAAWQRNSAEYPLGIYAPQAGEYKIFAPSDIESEDNIYLTLDGRVIWNLTYAPYYASLEQGTNTRYGLRLVRSNPAVSTGVENAKAEGYPTAQKILIDDKVYVLREGEVYTVTGQKAK